VSGPKSSRYRLSDAMAAELAARAERARQAELAAARLAAARRRWSAVRARLVGLRLRAESLRGKHGMAGVPQIPLPAADPGSVTEAVLRQAAEQEAAADRLDAVLAHLEEAARDQAARRTVAVLMSTGARAEAGRRRRAPDATAAGSATGNGSPDAVGHDQAIADAELAKLAPGVDRSPEIVALVTALPAEPDAARRRMLIDQLRTDVRARNTAARAAAELEAARGAAELTLARTDDAALRAVLARDDAPAAEVREAAVAAETRARVDREQAHVQEVLVGVFQDLAYDVAVGFDVTTPSGGVLVPRNGPSTHGVEITLREGVLAMEAVRLADGGPAHSPADRAAEAELCDLAPRVRAALAADGVDLVGLTGLPPGVVVPKARLDAARTDAAPARAARRRPAPAAPRERRLG
jgi:hypothetical protein